MRQPCAKLHPTQLQQRSGANRGSTARHRPSTSTLGGACDSGRLERDKTKHHDKTTRAEPIGEALLLVKTFNFNAEQSERAMDHNFYIQHQQSRKESTLKRAPEAIMQRAPRETETWTDECETRQQERATQSGAGERLLQNILQRKESREELTLKRTRDTADTMCALGDRDMN